MNRCALTTTLVLVTTFAVGCDPDDGRPTGPGASPDFGKTNTRDTDSRAIWAWYGTLDDSTPARITGDGKAADGVTPVAPGEPSAYRGDVCGVHAKIFWWNPDASRSSDAVFDPDMHTTGSCPARTLYLDLGSDPTPQGPFANVRQIMQIEDTQIGVAQTRVMGFSYVTGCSRLRFENVGDAREVLVTRGADLPDGARQWLVQSQGSHTANCYNTVKGKLQPTTTHTLPFKVRITEVLYAP